jgi:hypothetical protein
MRGRTRARPRPKSSGCSANGRCRSGLTAVVGVWVLSDTLAGGASWLASRPLIATWLAGFGPGRKANAIVRRSRCGFRDQMLRELGTGHRAERDAPLVSGLPSGR